MVESDAPGPPGPSDAPGTIPDDDAHDGPAEAVDEPETTPLLAPRDGVPDVSASRMEIARAADLLAAGHGPFAVDAERASGFRYSNRAYLVPIRRAGAGTVLIDPVSHGGDSIEVLAPVAAVLATDEWILHAADQDLPCLAEIGMRPPSLYDTELGGRLLNIDRVNLAAMVQRLLGLQLTKGHGAADWSKRPLPDDWLNYAALDVEVLIDLRDAVATELQAQGKTDWATQEFEHLRTVEPAPTRRDRWRRTSGIHKVRNPRALSAVRELWTTRDQIARRRDIAPGRILPDSALVSAATADPDTVEKLTALPIFGGSRQRRSATVWLEALARARTVEPPSNQEPSNGPPPASRWARRKPEAAARLEAARAGLAQVAERVSVPAENLLSPDLVRRLCWDWEPQAHTGETVGTDVEQFLATNGARPWQRDLTVPVLAEALATPAP